MTRIVVGVDGSDGSKAALAWAVGQARKRGDAKVVAVSSWSPTGPASNPWTAGYVDPNDLTDAKRQLAALVASVRGDAHDIDVEERVIRGSAVGNLMDEGRYADLIVVGSRGLGGFKGLLLGSVSHQLVSYAWCPVVVVPKSDSRSTSGSHDEHRIVVGVDGSRNSVAALEWAARWAHATGAQVRAVYAWQYPPMAVPPAHVGATRPVDVPREEAQHELAKFIAACEMPPDVQVEAHIRQGAASWVLLDEAAGAGLVVVGARGHGGFVGLLLGSVSSAITRHSPRPVAVIPCGRDAT